MNRFEHIDATTIEEAMELLAAPGAEALAGGTDLLGELKRGIRQPERLVNLKTIPGLRGIRMDGTEGGDLHIGTLTTLSEIESNQMIRERFPVVGQALAVTATRQIRNMGTLGGNLCQHPRCWYFRDALSPCWLKGGQKCFAATGENRHHAIIGSMICQSVQGSDLAPVLVSLDATAEIAGMKVNRRIPLEELYRRPGADHRSAMILRPGELITEVSVSGLPEGVRGVYLKAMERKAWTFATVSVAARLGIEGGWITDARLVLGGVAQTPWRVREAEALLTGRRPTEATFKDAADKLLAGATPIRRNRFKVPLAKALIVRALNSLCTG